jgi:hypothetical protein
MGLTVENGEMRSAFEDEKFEPGVGRQPVIDFEDLRSGQRATIATEYGFVHGDIVQHVLHGKFQTGIELDSGDVEKLDVERIRNGELSLLASPIPQHAAPLPLADMGGSMWPVIVESIAPAPSIPQVAEAQLQLPLAA